jgi:hypothetical protein
MFAAMSLDLQKQYEHVDAYTMIQGQRGIFENQERAERYNISKRYLHVSRQRVAYSVLM